MAGPGGIENQTRRGDGLKGFRSIYRSDTLLGRSIQSAGALSLASLFENGLRFLRNIILARLIAPEAFGLMAVVIAAVAAMEAMAEVGLVQSVIQNKKGKDERFLNIVWWLSAARGLLLFAIGILLAPHIAHFFGKPESSEPLRVGFSVIFLNGIISPRVHVLQKELQFTRWILLVQGAAFVGITTAIVGAFLIPNVWALVIGYVVEALGKTIAAFILYPFRPRFTLERTLLREITTFSRKIMGLPVLMMLFAQADTFVIGKLVSISALGMYVLAKDLAEIPNKLLYRISPVILPIFSLLQDDRKKLNEAVLKIFNILALFGIPFTVFLIAFAGDLLGFFYGPEYRKASLPFGILSLYAFLGLFSKPMMGAYMAIGQPNLQRTAALVRTLFFLAALYPMTYAFGLAGSATTSLLAMGIAFIIQLYYLQKVLGMDIGQFFRGWLPGAKWAVLIVIPGVAFGSFDLLNRNGALLLGLFFLFASWAGGAFELKRASQKVRGAGAIEAFGK